MKKIGIFLLTVLIVLSLTGCSGKDTAKARSEQFQSTPPKSLTSEQKQPEANQNSSDKNTPQQSTPAKNSSADQVATSNQITSLDATLKSLNEVVKSLENVTNEELTIPTP